jgi:hypothetical protein
MSSRLFLLAVMLTASVPPLMAQYCFVACLPGPALCVGSDAFVLTNTIANNEQNDEIDIPRNASLPIASYETATVYIKNYNVYGKGREEGFYGNKELSVEPR